jgi:hypothetical protein
VIAVPAMQFIRLPHAGPIGTVSRPEFDIVGARARLHANVIALASGKFGYWFWGYFTPAGHPAY